MACRLPRHSWYGVAFNEGTIPAVESRLYLRIWMGGANEEGVTP